MAQRKADSLELSCVQRLRAWERKHTSPVIRRTITVLCTGLFVYRLLQLSQWSHSLIVSRGLPSPHTVKAADDQALWLPQSWIGHPEPLDPLACIPQLLIIGVMKGGTTALFHYLNGSEPAIHYPNGTKSPVQFKSRCELLAEGMWAGQPTMSYCKCTAVPARLLNSFATRI